MEKLVSLRYPISLQYGTAILRDLGKNLIKAHSPNEALECLLKTDIAVILIDVCMPELDGFQLADMITRHPRFHETAIIFISGVQMTDLDRLKGYEHGAVDYISVPIIPELLRAKVRVFVDLHRKTEQLTGLYCDMQNLSRRILTLQDEERRRLARELHDGLGQELTAAKIMVDRIGGVNGTSRLQKPAVQSRKHSSRFGPSLIFCILPCWKKSDWFLPFAGTSTWK